MKKIKMVALVVMLSIFSIFTVNSTAYQDTVELKDLPIKAQRDVLIKALREANVNELKEIGANIISTRGIDNTSASYKSKVNEGNNKEFFGTLELDEKLIEKYLPKRNELLSLKNKYGKYDQGRNIEIRTVLSNSPVNGHDVSYVTPEGNIIKADNKQSENIIAITPNGEKIVIGFVFQYLENGKYVNPQELGIY